jgi:APA family basic amino acid/polyamine antiporter
MKGVISIGGLAVDNLFGKTMDSIFSLLISIALFSSISAFIILGPRVYYAMAKDGYFFKFASKLHTKYKVPTYSILFQAIISIIIILSGTLDQILTYMGFALTIFPILVVVGLFKLRNQRKSVLHLPGYPFTPVLFIFVAVMMLVLGLLERPNESLIAILTVLVGVPVYFLFTLNRPKTATD